MSTPPPKERPRPEDDPEPGDRDEPGDPAQAESPWDALLRAMLGPNADTVLRDLTEHGGMPDLGAISFVGPDGTPLDLEALAATAGLTDDPAALGQVLEQIKRVLDSSGEEPVNWELAHDLARQVAVAEGDPSVGKAELRELNAAFSAAELWLDAATDLPAAGGPVRAWSRSEWVEQTMGRWRSLAEPVAASVADALATALRTQAPDAMAALARDGQDLGGQMMRQLGGAVFGMQVGQAAGTLAREVFGTTDIGLPLTDGPGTALLPRNVSDFAQGLDVPVDEVRLFFALREAAHARLFTHVTWLRAHLLGTVEAYARGIAIDMSSLEEAVGSIDPTDPQALREALSEGVFSLETTPDQDAALLRLETALALVEGWVDEVTTAAARPHLPHTAALREMMRRRRAAGGPAEDTFATLVGLELRPRRSRDAAQLWAQIAADGGTSAREHVWDHPDLLPGPEDLDDPAGYAARLATARTEHGDVDRALAAILEEAEAENAGGADNAGGAENAGEADGASEAENAGEADGASEADGTGAADDEGPGAS